jgi:hypothetical protein
MTLQIDLPVDVEAELLVRAAAEGKEASTLVAEAVMESLAASDGSQRRAIRSTEGFEQRLQAWIDLHPRTGRRVDDSRESIYAGRGE